MFDAHSMLMALNERIKVRGWDLHIDLEGYDARKGFQFVLRHGDESRPGLRRLLSTSDEPGQEHGVDHFDLTPAGFMLAAEALGRWAH